MSDQITISVMSKAKARMLMKHVFFASLLLSTKVVAVPGCGTAFTDMIIIGYDPEFIDGLKDPDVVQFVLAHEMLHIILKHGFRRGKRDHQVWNIACDYAINLQLKESGFKLWDKCFVDDRFKLLSAEAIYEIIIKEPNKGRGGGQGKSGDGGLPGDIREPENMSPEDQAVVERKIERIVAQAASMARMAGKLGANLDRLVNGVLNPPLPWQELLKDFVTACAKDEMTWSHRDRRYANIYLPSLQGFTMGELVIIGDTSGSIEDKVFAQIGREIEEIIELLHPERVRVVWADAQEANHEEVFERHDPVILHPEGGGGTDMRLPLKYVEKYDPIVCILVTDGYTPWPDEEPPYPLVVVCNTNAHVPIGQVVRMLP